MSDDADVPRETSPTVSDTSRTLDLSDWLTKQQAADAIGVSTKAIERFTQAGKLEQRFRAQAHGPKVAVYFPDDVARLATERRPAPAAPFVVPVGSKLDPTLAAAGNGTGKLHFPNATSALTPIQSGVDSDPLRAFATAVVAAVMSQTSQTSAVSPTSFVTIQEASAITGLTQAYLRRAIEAEKLPAIRDRGWRIRRRDLEQL